MTDSGGWSTILAAPEEHSGSITVATVVGDKFLRERTEFDGNVSCIHLDVEGHEPQALRGLHDHIMESQPSILTEILGDDAMQKVRPLMTEMGYCQAESLSKTDFVWKPC